MFKRLRERITEEASKSVAQLGSNAAKSTGESENKVASATSSVDLITLNESSSVVMPFTSSQQFSIGEDDDGSMSEQSTPQKHVEASNGCTPYSTPSAPGTDFSFTQEYHPKRLSYVPQSDIESEREDPPTLNLEGISKDQLLSVIDILKARTYKYKNKYSEVVKNYKELRDEKGKIEKTLIDNQDKGSRRMAELREQCQLEQKAKAHLEANLRLMLEEKDNRISVLETQINYLKDTSKGESDKTQQNPDSFDDLLTGDSVSISLDNSLSLEKFERIEHQLNQAKKTITAQTDQIALLRKQNESLSKELEEKIKRLNELEDVEINLKKEHEAILENLTVRLDELEKQQEESVMAMAETKKNMHEELEFKEKQLVKAKAEASQNLAALEMEKLKVSELEKCFQTKINDLQNQLESTEKTLEDEKQNLMQELARGKTAAITLVQKDYAQKISAVEEEWKTKLQDLQSQLSKASESGTNLSTVQDKLKQSENQVKELNALLMQLEKENESLKSSMEKLKCMNTESKHEESMKCLKDKYGNAEKNYITQMEEMKQKISLLEKEKLTLEEEKKNLLKEREELSSRKSKLKSQNEDMHKEHLEEVGKMEEKMKSQDSKISKLEKELESLTKESSEKLETSRKKIKSLEVEREQLMHEAQERVSATEAKCREDLKLLQIKVDKLTAESKEMDHFKGTIGMLENQLRESHQTLDSSQAETSEKISDLQQQLSNVESRYLILEGEKKKSEVELLQQIHQIEEENTELLIKVSDVENTKLEKEQLNEQLKQAELKLSSMTSLQSERDKLKSENSSLSEQLLTIRASDADSEVIASKLKTLEENMEKNLSEKMQLEKENESLKCKLSLLKESGDKEVSDIRAKNETLSKQIMLLEKFDLSNPNSESVKDYIASVREECDKAIKAKEEDTAVKLKLLVRDFAEQMDLKDRDCDKITSEILEKNQDLEERLTRQHKNEIVELRQSLFEKECALDDIRDDYEEKLQEKDRKIKEYESTIKNINNSESGVSPDSALLPAESSDWDDTWVVPDETIESNTSPILSNTHCEEHLQEIETLKEELSKCNSEIKELKVLLRLSPPESMVNNNIRRESLQSIPEPTEFEYLKNIIYEYMMGKEPITLVKVIAAVLRFSDVQTKQVIRKEESRHQMR